MTTTNRATEDPFATMSSFVAMKARSCLKRLGKRSMQTLPEYTPIVALVNAGLAIRGKETPEKGIYNYRISPAGKAWLAKHGGE